MAELRVTSTGTIKLFESDDTSSVTIASPASLGGDRTITLPDANVDLTEVNTMPIANLDIDGGTDIGAAIVDADLFIIDDGAGGTNRKTTASRIKTYVGGVSLANDANNRVVTGDGSGGLNGEANLTFDGNALVVAGTAPSITIGDAGAEDTKIVFDGNAQDFHIGLDDSADSLTIGLGSTLGTTSHMVIDATGAVTKPLQPAYGGYKNSSTSNATGDGTELILGDSSHAMSEIYDNNADFDTSTGTFTCPVTGRYLMSLNLFAGDVTNSITDILIKLEASNRTVYWRREPKETAGTSNNTIGYSINAILDADTNDTLKFKIAMSGTTKTVDIIDLTQMSIELLG